MATTYSKITYDGKKVQVDSAIRDGNGKQIDTNYQEKLVSGNNIKTVNGNSLLGNGDITIEGGGSEWKLATTEKLIDFINASDYDSSTTRYKLNIIKDLKLVVLGYASTTDLYVQPLVINKTQIHVMNGGITIRFGTAGAYNPALSIRYKADGSSNNFQWTLISGNNYLVFNTDDSSIVESVRLTSENINLENLYTQKGYYLLYYRD